MNPIPSDNLHISGWLIIFPFLIPPKIIDKWKIITKCYRSIAWYFVLHID